MPMLAADHELLGIVPRRAATTAGLAASSRCGTARAVPTFQCSNFAAGHVVLLDDDAARLAEPLRRILAAPGGQVHILNPGPTTIDRICALSPDAVVLDLSESGLETFRQTRRVNSRALVVFVAGPTRADDAVEAMKLGAHEIHHRLSVFSIHVPPLRDRGDDLPMLVDHYLRQSSRQLNRDVREVSSDAMERLHDYAWPGNVRELQSVIKQALLNAKGGVLISSFLPNLSAQVSKTQTPQATATDGWGTLDAFVRQRFQAGSNRLSGEALRELDRVLPPAVLEFTDCNQTRAAQVLGVSRHTLRQRLRRTGFALAPRIDIDAG